MATFVFLDHLLPYSSPFHWSPSLSSRRWPAFCSFITSTLIPTLASLYNVLHLSPNLRQRSPHDPTLNWPPPYSSLPQLFCFLRIYHFLLYIGHFFFLLILFLPKDKSVAGFFSPAALWGRTGPLPSNKSVSVCWRTQEGCIINSRFASGYMRRVVSALSLIHVREQKPLWYASNHISKTSVVFILRSLIVCLLLFVRLCMAP